MTFADFWTNQNNPELPKSVYLYGTRHLIVLALVVVACIVFTAIFYKRSEKAKNILFKVFASILLFFEIASRIVNLIIEKNYTVENIAKILLPMHICSVMVWVFIIAIFTKKRFLLEYGVIGGGIATLAFLAFPAVGLNRTYMSFTCIYSTFSHMLGFVTVVLLMTLRQVKFEWKRIWQPLVCFVVMFLWGVLLNWVIFPGADYMYLRNDPLELGLPIPYQIVYAVILVVYTCAFYLGNCIIDKIRARKLKQKSAN
ncbi:MAG: YwaF family protein [Clostridia bacterium]|nr:YwaF family protein [Clostridia bacterium]